MNDDAGRGVGLDDLVSVSGPRGLGDDHLVESTDGKGHVHVCCSKRMLGIRNQLCHRSYEVSTRSLPLKHGSSSVVH